MSQLDYPPTILDLIQCLKSLPGIGSRGAERLALWMLNHRQQEAKTLAICIQTTMDCISPCPECGFFVEDGASCPACADPLRDHTLICVVEEPTDILPIERSRAFNGVYHSLGGKLSPLDDIGPEDLRIDVLLQRVDAAGPDCEVILATGSDVEGEATAAYLTELLKKKQCRISRLAQGMPAGSGLEQADPLTLIKALQGRTACQ